LISTNELAYLMQAFDFIDRNGGEKTSVKRSRCERHVFFLVEDGFIILNEFLSFEPNKQFSSGFELFVQFNRDLGRIFFRAMDVNQEGAVGWSDFALFYSCKLIISKNKVRTTDFAGC
jgi:hypothetical protein